MLTLRAAVPEDAPALSLLHRQCFDHGGWSEAQMQGSLDLATTRGWVVEENKRPAGFILYQALEHEAEILTLCVDPARRRKGIGRKLIDAVLSLASGQSSALWLEVASDNAAAIALYEQSGFTVTGRRPGYYQRPEGAVDAVVMSLSLQQRD